MLARPDPKVERNMKNQSRIEPDKILNGRSMPCPVKYGFIIQKWLDLAVGDYFVLVNDRDPVRMREQFSAEWSGAFDWQYLQKGPDEFQVKITRLRTTPLRDAVGGCCGGH